MEQQGNRRPGKFYAVADPESKDRGTLDLLFKTFLLEGYVHFR